MGRPRGSITPATLGALIVLAFVITVGRPAVFTDTRDYMIHGARFYQALRRTFLNEQTPSPKTPAEERAWEKLHWQMHFDHSNAGARSPYYGIFLYTLAHRGTLWLLTGVQSLICAWLLFLLWRAMAPGAPAWTYYTMMAALAAGTSLPWISSFAMPDIFAAVLIMSATLLVLYRETLKRWELVATIALIGASIVFHNSHLLLAITLVPVGVGLGLWLKAKPEILKSYAAIVLTAVAVSMVASATYGLAIRLKTGDEFRRPPFLIARVLADGPGRAYLRESCARGVKWVICPFKNLPLDYSDDILWSAKVENGVFNRSNYEQRLGMEKQELAFVVGTVVHHPLTQLGASLENWGEQLVNFYVDDPLRPPLVFFKHEYWGKTNLVGLMRGAGDCGKIGELCMPKVKIVQLEVIQIPLAALSIVALIIALLQPQALGAVRRKTFEWSEPSSRATAACLMILAAIVINAGVCGIFAGPFARYQSRVIWLISAAAMLLPMALVPEAVWRRTELRLPPVWIETAQAAWARLAPARATAQALWSRLDPAFLRFGVVGAVGFVVDALALHALTGLVGLNPFVGQAIAFPAAVLVTWPLNRAWTFRRGGQSGRLKQAAVYFGVQCAGFAANYVVYSAALMTMPVLRHWLVIPLALGAAMGLCVTFAGSKHLAFRVRRQGLPGDASAVADTPAA